MARHPTAESRSEALPEDIAAALAAALAAPPVAAEQAARIRAKIGAGIAAHPAAATHRLGEGAWLPLSAGFEIKILNFDESTRCYSYLGRLHAGASISAHAHRSVEECVIVSGEIEVDGATYRAGDYQVYQPGTRHSTISSRDGALLFLRSELHLPR